MKPLLEMGDLDMEAFVVSDILHADPPSPWRWTNEHPRVQLWLDAIEDRELYIKLSIPPDCLHKTGPVTVKGIVGQSVIGSSTYDTPEAHELTQPVPAGLLSTDAAVTVGLDISPPFVTSDGTRLGVVLYTIGFRARAR